MKKIFIVFAVLQLTACSVSLDKIKHSSFETAVYPADMPTTLLCLDTASLRNHFHFEEQEPLAGGEKRFTLGRKPHSPLINLDMRENHGKTHIDYVIDRREHALAADLDAMLAYCKLRLNHQ